MMTVSIIVIGLFYFGGVEDSTADLIVYKFVDPILYWAYILIIAGFVSILLFGIYKFAIKSIDNPKAAFTSLSEIIMLVVLLATSWFLGSGKPLNLPGYDGTENVYFWLKWSDMLLFTTYILLGLAIGSMVFFNIFKLFRR